MPDRYTFPGTEVLRNKFGISDQRAAHDLETAVAYQGMIDVARHPVKGSFDLRHLRALHTAIFRDLWDWAGEIRTTDTGAVGTGLAHCRPEFILTQAASIFGAIAADDALKGMDRERFTERLAEHWGELTALHPFRDGNTRTQPRFSTR